ncbi:hypothetical protein BsIDN1_27710 [Bacillus safensis]|uniref:PTS EIIB type-5 domain-containing protein n=1 Tax=Bacillus safensis TaxID=561879 RepID=A0A5S9M7P3_BACIA|nr:hypothetical protein BsIDN1_27710 [Bacillus safensis]
MTGTEACDGFKNSIPEDEMMCVVIDCGGTARIGLYPMKRIPTVDVLASSPSGPLAKHITEDIFVSGVTEKKIFPMQKHLMVRRKQKVRKTVSRLTKRISKKRMQS